eukprot:Rhum_TRINITY_DN1257_c0_g2::Rhum_TRINITY_DN1257_c0_g2_i1::g.3825::m.3825
MQSAARWIALSMALAALLYTGCAVPGSHAYDGNEMTAASALLPRTRLRPSLELIQKQDADILSLKTAVADLAKIVEEGQEAHRLDKVVMRKLEGDVVQLQRTQSRPKEDGTAPLQRRPVLMPGNVVSAAQAEPAGAPRQKKRPAKFLLLSALPTSFASGLKSQIYPFLAMAAAYGRTAVLPAASFGYPAFRTASGLVPFEELVDVDSLRHQFPCVRVITYADWRNLTASTVDSLLFLGTEDEIGRPLEGAGAAGKLSPDDEPATDCYPAYLKDIRNAVAAGADTYAGRSRGQVWDFSLETKHVVASERLRVRRVKCASTQSLMNASRVLSAATGSLRDDRSVMIANFPGMRKGPFVWSTSWKSEVRRLFKDVPERLCDATVDSRRLKYFELAQAWKAVADDVVERRFGGDFACIHMRTEKLIFSGLSAGWGTTAIEVLQSANMHRCMRAAFTLIRRRGSSLFLLTDLSTAAGSPSAANKVLTSWVSRQETELRRQFGPALGFCGTDDEVRATTSGPRSVQRALRRDPRNCAAVEAAVCQRAQAHIRFGDGMMGEYATGYSGDLQKYATCKDVFAALDLPV